MLNVTVDVRKLSAFARHLQDVKQHIEPNLRKIVKEIGPEATQHMKKVLPGQTGLKYRTINKALKGKMVGAKYEIYSHGGNIRLRFFSPRETGRGVSAAPWNKRRVYAASFIRAGWWPNRSKKRVAGGDVVVRTGKGKFPIERVMSGLFIPDEMITGRSLVMFNGTVEARFAPAIEKLLLKAI